jgi:hypothetical protein
MISQKRRIAIVGSGISGLGAAFALQRYADITVYESADRIGGHAWTVDVDYDGKPIAVDIGFICYNEPNYPNLSALFAHLGVETIATDMSFSVSDPSGYEWSSDVKGLFAWKRNLLDVGFLSLLREILRFNNLARAQLRAGAIPDISLRDYLVENGFSPQFASSYLLPMGAAIWSTPERDMTAYPVDSFIRFFDNHRLMHALRPLWKTVKGGSRSYVDRLAMELGERVRTGRIIRSIEPASGGGVIINEPAGVAERFDAVILAAHGDQSAALLSPAFEDQHQALRSIRFSSNTAYLHRDPALMPQRKNAWASWNVMKGQEDRVCVTYWMNRLQAIPKETPLFVTLNPVRQPDDDKTFGVYSFEHPMYDRASAVGRDMIRRIQGRNGVYFSGAWLGDGFHEAGLRTGLEAAAALGGATPWPATLQQRYPVFLDVAPSAAVA